MPGARYVLIGSLIIALLLSCAQMERARILPSETGEPSASEGTPESALETPIPEPSPGEIGAADIGEGDVGDGEEYAEGEIGGPAEEVGAAGMAAAIPAMPEERASPKARAAGAPAVFGLRAGFADDNRQFNYFLQFLQKYRAQAAHLPIPVDERILLRAADSEGKPLVNAAAEIYSDSGRLLCTDLTYSDGSFMFFPEEYGPSFSYRAVVTVNQVPREVQFQREGPREVSVRFDFPRPQVRPIPLDILFILDTTGSMGEEIERLKSTIEIINLNLSSLSARPLVRFGMVLYRDRGDIYLNQVVPFTADLDNFQIALNRVKAEGGGDEPEDLQAALKEAMGMDWSRNGIRLAFVITDAPPHLDYGERYTYVDAVHDARAAGIKIFSVGSGGLNLAGEYVLRQISQYTAAKYIFLTYGELSESEGSAPGSISRHTGASYQTDKLEVIIIRLAKEELANVLGQPLEGEEDYLQATRVGTEKPAETLDKLFTMAVSQLIDYSTFRLPPDTPASVLPLSPAGPELKLPAEYFTEQLMLNFSRADEVRKTFRILERKDLQKVLEELELELAGLADEKQAARVGELIGAQVLVIGKLYAKGGDYELFLKLLRVETGEVLSVAKEVIDRKLGLGG